MVENENIKMVVNINFKEIVDTLSEIENDDLVNLICKIDLAVQDTTFSMNLVKSLVLSLTKDIGVEEVAPFLDELIMAI